MTAKICSKGRKKKLCFPINKSSVTKANNFRDHDLEYKGNDLRGSIQRIRRELIQDDSDDELMREKANVSKKVNQLHSRANLKEKVDLSYDSNPLQKIIEQRKLESSTDSEESEEELDDDYDIGIDDIELKTEGLDEDPEVRSTSVIPPTH